MGIVGCGQIAQIMHLPFLKELPQYEIAAVCDISAKVVNTVGEWYHVAKRFTDYRELVAQSDLDIVLVLNNDHADVVEAAADAGKNVFVEKPLCFSMPEGDRILAAARRNRIQIMVGYMKRFDPGYQYGVEQIKGMQEVRLVRVHNLGGNFGWHPKLYTLVTADDISEDVLKSGQEKVESSMRAALGPAHAHLWGTYSMLLGLCSHDFAVLRGAFGAPQRVLYSDAYSKSFMVSVFDYGDGMRCVFEGGLSMDLLAWDESFTAYGKNRNVNIKFPNPYVKYAPTVVTVDENLDGSAVTREIPVSYDEAFRREWQHFYDCIQEKREPLTNAADAKADVELAIEMLKAVRV